MNDNIKDAGDKPEAQGPRLYRILWRWHFYAGLLFAPILIMLAVTGAVYLFKPQLEPLIYKHLYEVPAGSQQVPVSAQLDAVKQRYPDAKTASYRPSDKPGRTAEVGIKRGGEGATVFVNPYTGAVVGDLATKSKLMEVMKKLHGELLIGKIGDRIVELTACWGIILLVTGVYLWWPRGVKSVFGTLLPRFRQGKRTFWRDLHAVPALWLSLGIAVLIMTGLPWSGVWGDTVNKWAASSNTGYPEALWDRVPESAQPTKAVAQVPWAAENMPVPVSVPSGAGGTGQTLAVEQIVSIAESKRVHPGYNIQLPQGETGVYTVSVFPTFPKDQATLHIDQYSGQVLADLRFADYGLSAKVIEIGIALHEGRYFGLPNQILALLLCVGLVVVSATGPIMWWKRKPKGKLGAPAAPKERRFLKGVAVIVIAFGLFFPLVGISMIAVVAADWLLIRRIPKVKAFFAA